ncbi:unnamed protein product [Lupinus luteus]|uniref:Uncharacterized protein n=1 Tax=Lupinus luteus TaxID=3873 RepID=A0AAV1WTS6_LUPLU
MYQQTSDHAHPPHNQPTATGYPVSYSGNHPPIPLPYTSAPPPEFKAVSDWSTDLFDCFSDYNSCCLTLWCPCVTFGRIAEIVDKGSTSCGASGALYTLITYLTGFGCLYSCFYRTKMRKQYMLKESPCCDCLVHCFCETCALCQEYRELQNRGFDMVAGWNANAEVNRGVSMAPTYEHMTR